MLTRRPILRRVVDALAPFAGRLIVVAWGVDVPVAADGYLAIVAPIATLPGLDPEASARRAVFGAP